MVARLMFLLCLTGLCVPGLAREEKDYGEVYEVVNRRCKEGILNNNASIIKEGTLLTRDAFYRDSLEVNKRLEEGREGPIDLPYSVSGNPQTICNNGNKKTSYILTVKKVEWPRK